MISMGRFTENFYSVNKQECYRYFHLGFRGGLCFIFQMFPFLLIAILLNKSQMVLVTVAWGRDTAGNRTQAVPLWGSLLVVSSCS